MDLEGTRFRVVRLIAVGGMAEVYLAREQLIDGVERSVVLKRLLPQYRDDDEFVTMFFDEVRVSATLRHPNLAQLIGAFRHRGDSFIVLEHVDGISLRGLLDARAGAGHTGLPELEAASIALVLAEALGYVHSARDELGRALNIVHRDVNPSNVVLARTGALKLIDFGIASGESRVHETATGMMKGTVGYMAPEQLEEQGETDARTDVFALGVLLYEMLVGVGPFHSRSPLETYERIIKSQYLRLSKVRPGGHVRIERLVARCLVSARESRPHGMDEVAAELRAVLSERRYVPSPSALATLIPAWRGEDRRPPRASPALRGCDTVTGDANTLVKPRPTRRS